MQIKNILANMIKHISACMSPVVPALVAGGLVNILILVLGYTPLFENFPHVQQLLAVIGDAPFYFLPILVAFSAAGHFQTDYVSALVVTGALLSPSFISCMEQEGGVSFLGIPVYQMSYAYTVLPIIVMIFWMSRIEKWLEKHLKGILYALLSRLVLILLTAFSGILVIGPAVGTLSQMICDGIIWLQMYIPVLAWAVFGATAALQVMIGVHWFFVIIVLQDLGELGMENGFMAGYFLMTMSLTAVAAVAALREKAKKSKNEMIAALVTVFFTGTTEPVIYGVCLKHGVALLAAILGGAVGGIYQGLVSIHSYAYAFPTLFSILMFQSPERPMNMWHALIAGMLSFGTAFAVMWAGYGKSRKKKTTEK